MNALYRMALAGLAGAAVIAFAATNADAQQKPKTLKQGVVGTWELASDVNTRADGSKYQAFGGNTKGILVLDRRGHFVISLMGDARQKFAANTRLEGTAEENKSVVRGSISYFGTYSVNEKDHVLVFHVQHSSFPNWDGTEQRRSIMLTGDELQYSNMAASSGGSATLIWHRAK